MVEGVRTWREISMIIENLECEAVDLLHDLCSPLHLLAFEAEETLGDNLFVCFLIDFRSWYIYLLNHDHDWNAQKKSSYV